MWDKLLTTFKGHTLSKTLKMNTGCGLFRLVHTVTNDDIYWTLTEYQAYLPVSLVNYA